MIGELLPGEILPGAGGTIVADPSLIEMNGALGDTVVYGPDYLTDAEGTIITEPGEYPVPLSLEVVDTGALSTIITTLGNSFARSFNDELNETGSGTFTLSNDAPGIPLADLDKMVTFKVYGTRAYSMLIESKHKITIDEGEEFAQVTTHNGRGHVSVFERAVMYPSRGVGVQPIEEDRTFNWSTPSPVYDDSWWSRATQICTVGVAQSIWLTQPFAAGWHDLTAGVIWAPTGTTTNAPSGYCYFRKDVFIPTDGFYLLEAACDNEGELWLDGQRVIDLGGFTSTFDYDVYITAGWHTIAVRGYNAADDGPPGGNPGGLIMALFSLTSSGQPDTVIFHTDSTWKIVAYPDKPPGMRVGKVLHLVYDEALARGVLDFDNINLKFTTLADSSGQAWPETLDIATKVGTDYLTFLTELSSTYIDWWMKPGTLDLYVWKKNTRTRRSSKATLHGPTDVEDPLTSNIFEQTHTVFG